MKTHFLTFLSALRLFIGLLLTHFLVEFLYGVSSAVLKRQMDLTEIVYLSCFSYSVFLLPRKSRTDFLSGIKGLISKDKIKIPIAQLILISILVFMLNVMIFSFASAGGVDTNFLVAISKWVQTHPVHGLIAAVFLGPILEEIFFRQMILTRLSKSGKLAAILGSSLLFALAHLKLIQILYAFPAGLILGFLFQKSKDIRIPVLLHVLNNFMAIIFAYLNWNLEIPFIPASIIFISSLFGLIFLLRKLFKSEFKENSILFE